jgi:hypothetical protein
MPSARSIRRTASTTSPLSSASCRTAIRSIRSIHQVGFRRILLLAAHPREGRFTQPTTAAQVWRLELVFLPPELPFMTAPADGRVGSQADIRTGLLHMRSGCSSCGDIAVQKS